MTQKPKSDRSWENIKEEMTETFPIFANKSTQEDVGGILQAGEVLALIISTVPNSPLSKEHFPSMNLDEKNKRISMIKKEQKKGKKEDVSWKVKSIKTQAWKMTNIQILANQFFQ